MNRSVAIIIGLLCLFAASVAGCGRGAGGAAANPPTTAAPSVTSPAETETPPTGVAPTVETTPTAAMTATEPASSTAEATPTLEAGMYRNPVLARDFPDPDVLQAGDAYYAYATNADGVHVQVARSADLVQWEMLGDALPELPAWAVQEFGWTWAPEVFRPTDTGPYVMYYTTRFAIGQGGIQCIGAAVSDAPEGPFTPVGDGPAVCQRDQGGSIDPASFRDDDGSLYLLWKNDGNSRGGQTWLYVQPLSADGLTLTGEPTRLLTVDQLWEGALVEAPTLWQQDGTYYLFYSANDYASPRYATGYATAEALTGPYTKAAEPLLKTDLKNGVVGPGGQDIVTGPQGDTWIVFHGWTGEAYRSLYLARLSWQDGAPVVEGLSREAVPAP